LKSRPFKAVFRKEKIMKRFVLVALVACLAAAPFGRADEWSKTYTLTGKPDLRVETSDANIRVDTWDQKTIEARVVSEHYKIGGRGLRIEEHQSGDSVQLEIHFPHDVHIISFNVHSYRVDVEIHMPREGRVDLRSGDGSIRLANFKGEMDLQTGDGHQDIDSVDGALRARAGDGRITAGGRFDILELRTGDGRIEARAASGSTVSSSWTLHTGDGSITLQLPANFAADLELRTSDGPITADIPVAVDGRLSEKNIHGKINGGGNLITVRTGGGSIRLQKS
jgi:DUF4097 and DUF4098 domain-containing protein YvlB